MNRLENKVAVITGATGGIGAATARLFVAEGAQVMLVDRDERLLHGLCDALGKNAAFTVADVSDTAQSQRYVNATIQRFGGLDILFANAGIEGPVTPLSELRPEDFERVWAVNVRGVFLGIKFAMPALIARGGGSIMVTSSVAGLIGSPGLAAYVTSKHALIGLTRTAALEGGQHKVRVNTINPGPIDNRMMRGIEEQSKPEHPEEIRQGFEAQVPLGRYGKNEEIAQLALFLASDDSSYCTGSVFVADGGFIAH